MIIVPPILEIASVQDQHYVTESPAESPRIRIDRADNGRPMAPPAPWWEKLRGPVRNGSIMAEGIPVMKITHNRILLCSLAAVAYGSGCSGLRSGTVAPDFTLVSLAGKDVSLSQFNGRPVVLSYFATW